MQTSHDRALLLILLGLASALASTVAAEVVVDQHQLDGSDQNNLIHSTRSLGQTFVVGIPGTLAALELSLYQWYVDPDDELSIEVLDVTFGLAGAPVLGSTTVFLNDLGPSPQILDLDLVTATLIDLTLLGIDVSVGDILGVRLSSEVVLPAAFYVRTSTSNPYTDGMFFSNDSFWRYHDLAFKTFVATPPLFHDGFESGDTSGWTMQWPPP